MKNFKARQYNIYFKLAIAFLMVLTTYHQSNGQSSDQSYVQGKTAVEAGKYLIVVGGCNDCHTPNYMFSEGNVPEDQWLTGWDVGFRGPWGTTYASNLRLSIENYTEEEWVKMLKTRKKLPPMPWMNVNEMSEQDMQSIYAYIKSLEVKGTKSPDNIGPEEEPNTPFISMMPQNMTVQKKND